MGRHATLLAGWLVIQFVLIPHELLF